jgi:transcriptional regulator of acetoin/glycerol metabolism
MASKRQLQNLVQRIAALPEDEQAELLQSLVEMRANHLGIYELDDDERAALGRSAEDMRGGRFASEDAVEQMFARYRPGA